MIKSKIIIVFIFFFYGLTFVQAQSKSELQENLNNCTTKKESIQKSLTNLSSSYDSLNLIYDNLYGAIKEKVFKNNFNPNKMSVLIDSLQNSASFGTTLLNDSISSLLLENAELKEQLAKEDAELKEMHAKEDAIEADINKISSDLKQLKELLDGGILTQEEFDEKKTKLLEKL